MFLYFRRKDTLFFRDVQEKSLFSAIFLVYGVKAATSRSLEDAASRYCLEVKGMLDPFVKHPITPQASVIGDLAG